MNDFDPETPSPGAKMQPLLPGKDLRFVVVDTENGNQSSTWIIKTGRKKDDIYLMEIVTGKGWKASHHNDAGLWRIAMTSEGAAQWGLKRQEIDEWPRMPPVNGWSEGVAVLVPTGYLRSNLDQVSTHTIRIPLTPSYSAIVIRLFFEEPDAIFFETPYSFPVGIMLRSNGGRLIVIAEPTNLEEKQIEMIEELCNQARENQDDQPHPSGRVVGVARMDDHRTFIDICVS